MVVFLERIRENYRKLTPTQKRIADYLSSSYYDAAFMNASQLARHLETDTATVIRFAQKLGYPGYPELLQEIKALAREKLRVVYEIPPEERGVGPLFRRSLINDRANLEEAIAHIQTDAVSEAVAHLKGARNIYIIGQGAAMYLGNMLASRLQQAGLPGRAIGPDVLQWARFLDSLSGQDVVIALGFALAFEVADALRLARDAGAKTIGLVGSVTSPIAQVAELVLVCPSQSASDMPSLTSMAAVINALFEALALEKPEEFSARLERYRQTFKALVGEKRK